MKILRIYTKLPPMKGGMEKHIRYLTEYQLVTGHEVSLFFNQGEKLSSRDIRILGVIKLFRIRPQFLGMLIFYIPIICYLMVKPRYFDVLHIHGDWNSFLWAGILKKITRSKKMILSFHGSTESYGRVKKFLLHQTVSKTNLVFCTGYNSFELLKWHPGAIFQPSGVDPVFFESSKLPKNTKTTVITVSRLEKVKNLETVLEIAKMLPELDFIIAGQGSCRQKLEKIVKKEGIKNVVMTGQLDKYQLADHLNSAHIFLLTSFEEGTPTAALEAMSAGLALVVSNAGGIKAIIESGKNGFIIDQPTDVPAFTRAIKSLITDKSELSKIQVENKRIAENFRWTVVGERITQKMIDA